MSEILQITIPLKSVIILCFVMMCFYVLFLFLVIRYRKERDWANERADDLKEDKEYFIQLYRCESIRNRKLSRKVKHLESNIKNCLRNI